MGDYEFKMTFLDDDDYIPTVWISKVGGGTIGRLYDGDWKIMIDGPYGQTDVMNFRTGMSKSHFEAGHQAYGHYISEKREI